MKIHKLIDMLSAYDDDEEVVIRTQTGHALYGDIGHIDYHEEVDYDTGDFNDKDGKPVIIIDFKNESYSPSQALGLD